jgi:hypothetical protein
MSGPIVRTGATPEYWENWDKIFGNKKTKKTASGTAAKKSAPRKKSAKKVAAKKASAKPAKKKSKK